ncbi:MAG: CDP-alcohol phosphatidyltransferase [Bergeyella sp.]|nr:CDP-alcohol phosphatidyltransferase [Bergeyella sp.]
MAFIKNNVAHVFTLGNLVSGSIACVQIILGDYRAVGIFLTLSLIFDFLDGFIARALHSNSNLGAELDSLADMISFGFLPGLVFYKALEPFDSVFFGINFPFPIQYFGFLLTVFSALRLALFNLDEEQKFYFKGLNTPSCTLMVFGFFYAYQKYGAYSFLLENKTLLLLGMAFLSWLLISRVKMMALKSKSKKWKDNIPKIILLSGSLLILILLGVIGIPLVVIFYILLSLSLQGKLN